MRWGLFWLGMILNSALVPAEGTTTVVVFFPEGTAAVLSASDGTHGLTSGTPLVIEAGEGDLSISHGDCDPYLRRLTLEPGAQLILVPRLRPSSGYRQDQQNALLRKRELQKVPRDSLISVAAGLGVLAAAGWAAAGGVEWALASKKSTLTQSQEDYRSASADRTDRLWTAIESLKADIVALRTYESAILVGSAGLTLGALALWCLAPDNDSGEDRPGALE